MNGNASMLRRLACTGVVSLAMAAGSAGASDWRSTPTVPSDLLDAAQRDLQLNPDQFLQYMHDEANAFKVIEQAKKAFGDHYAGGWFTRDEKGALSVVLASTSPKQASALLGDLQAKVEIDLVSAQFSLKDLQEMVAQLDTAAKSAGAETLAGLHSWGVDVRQNRIAVTVSDEQTEKSVDFFSKSGVNSAALSFDVSEHVPSTMVNVYGGLQYNGCSIGFPVRRGSTQGFVTAGHCGNVGSTVRISGVNVGSFQRSDFPGADAAWANVRSSDRLYNVVSRYNGQYYSVTGSQSAPIGATVCRSGFRTGWRCGSITRNNVTVNYSNGPVYGLRESNACAGQGDSGGSWVAAGNQAQGVTSGGALGSDGTNCGIAQSQRRSWFQPINPMLNAYGVTLVTN